MLSPVVYTVGQVAAYLKDKLESDPLLSRLTVQGEIANLRTVPSSGHSYFSLRGDRGKATLRCVMFKGRSGQQHLDNGAEILASGSFTFYPPGGDANLQVAVAVPVGAGALALELERLRQQLDAEGLFDPSRKRPLPAFPRIIGVVTSPSGAVWQDIGNVARRRYPLAELRLAPAAVQGDAAADQIARAIEVLNDEGLADVIIVARGGGSLEDLWCFNSETVARAIFASAIPIVSAVGHETDHTIADDVADRRAPTPSAAAELVTPDRIRLLATVQGGRQQAASAFQSLITRQRSAIMMMQQRLTRRAPDIGALRRQVDDLQSRATDLVLRDTDHYRRDVALLSARLTALEPAATLRRGYAVVHHAANGQAITRPQQAQAGAPLSITLAGGNLDAIAGRPDSGNASISTNGLANPTANTAPTPTPQVAVSQITPQSAANPRYRGRRRRRPTDTTGMNPLL